MDVNYGIPVACIVNTADLNTCTHKYICVGATAAKAFYDPLFKPVSGPGRGTQAIQVASTRAVRFVLDRASQPDRGDGAPGCQRAGAI